MLLFFLVLAITSIHKSQGNSRTEKFVCENFACHQASISNNTVQYYESVELCRLVCGQFGNLWPIPTETLQLGRMAMEIDPTTVEILIEDHGSDELKKYLNDISKLFLMKLWQGCQTTRKPSTIVQVRLRAKHDDLILDTDTTESYKIAVTTNGRLIEAFIEGDTAYGVRHGLETLLQLTARKGSPEKCSVLMLTRAVIKDSPIFKHRGILIDTARNFIPVSDLKRTIDGMGSVKLNVLHWHAVDSHSFPLEIKNIPQMARTGAYSSQEVYTVEDQRELIEYAKLRGVRILLEIDSPAHAGNGWTWGKEEGLGDLVLCANKEPWREFCMQPPCGQMNPANPNIYKVMGSLFKEVNQRFTTDDLFHLGGDEVKVDCWNATESVRQYMIKKGWGDLSELSYLALWAEFHRKSLHAWDSAVGHNKTNVILWTSDLTEPSIITNRLDPRRFIIQTWEGISSDIPRQLLDLGYKMIFSTQDAWYLDHGFWGETVYHTWKTVYNYVIPTTEQVLGGEVCMWTEYVDSNSLDTRVWPRAAALAERLWSDPKTISRYQRVELSNQVEYRLASARDRLIRLGIRADQIMPRWCYLNQDRCSDHYFYRDEDFFHMGSETDEEEWRHYLPAKPEINTYNDELNEVQITELDPVKIPTVQFSMTGKSSADFTQHRNSVTLNIFTNVFLITTKIPVQI